jgi:hypothetical protein
MAGEIALSKKSAVTDAAAPARRAAGSSIAATTALTILASGAALAGRLKVFLFALGRLALDQRMSAARAEIKRGRERLWLGRNDGEEKSHLKRAAHEDMARAETGMSSKTNSVG